MCVVIANYTCTNVNNEQILSRNFLLATWKQRTDDSAVKCVNHNHFFMMNMLLLCKCMEYKGSGKWVGSVIGGM